MALLFKIAWLGVRIAWIPCYFCAAVLWGMFSAMLFGEPAGKTLPASSIVGPSKQLMATIGPRGGRYYERTSKDGNNYRQYF